MDILNIQLNSEDIDRCKKFADSSAPTQQAIEYGQNSTKERPIEEISRDTLIGKLGEVAFQKILKENYNIDIDIDFNTYPKGKYDKQDATINGWRIDVKSTKAGSRWMLIEWNKLDFRQKENCLSHLYTMFTVEWDKNNNEPTGKVRYEGTIFINKLKVECKGTKVKVLKKGTILPGTEKTKPIPLQADNFGIRLDELNSDLDRLLTEYVLKSPPSKQLTDNFINPYTGKNTLQMMNK